MEAAWSPVAASALFAVLGGVLSSDRCLYSTFVLIFIKILLSLCGCVCVVYRHRCGQFVSRCVCRRLQEVECAILFSSAVQRRTAQRIRGAGNDAGLRFGAILWFIFFIREHILKQGWAVL